MKARKTLIPLVICLMFMSALSLTVHADVGPKDSLTVYVKNPPSELYYLDLLTQDSSRYGNINEEREKLNQKMLELLYSYESEGWFPALTEGTGMPMWGNLIGQPDGDNMKHEFGYFGVPNTYRIIIVTESGNVSVSEVFTREALQSSITFDYAKNEAYIPPVAFTYFIQFGITFALTLLFEGVILLLFRIKLKENWKIFLIINFITQIILTLTVGITLIKSGTISAYIVQVPAEFFILVGETVAFALFFKGISVNRRVAYGIVANLTSWFLGFFLLNSLFLFLNTML